MAFNEKEETMDEIQTVPLAAYESMSTRLSRIIKWLIMGWALSMVAFGLVLVISLSYSEEVVSESTETTAEVIQDAESSGSNYYAGGDLNGYTEGNTDGQDNANNGQTE